MQGFSASFLRSVFVLIILIPWWLLARKRESLNLKENYLWIIGLLAFSMAIWGPLYYAFNMIGIGFTLALATSSMIVWVFIFSFIFLKEKLNLYKASAILLAILGIFFVYYSDRLKIDSLGVFLALLSGLGYGGNIVCMKKLTYNTTQSNLVLWSTSFVSNLFMLLIIGEDFPDMRLGKEYLYLLGFALVSILANQLMIASLKLVEAQIVSILSVLEIVFAACFGIIFFNENINIIGFFGMGLIMLAAILPSYVKYVRSKRKVLER